MVACIFTILISGVVLGASSREHYLRRKGIISSRDEESVDADKAFEYQQVAALLAMDIEVFSKTVEHNPEMAKDAIEELAKRRERILTDKEYRDMRYGAASTLAGLKASQ